MNQAINMMGMAKQIGIIQSMSNKIDISTTNFNLTDTLKFHLANKYQGLIYMSYIIPLKITLLVVFPNICISISSYQKFFPINSQISLNINLKSSNVDLTQFNLIARTLQNR